MAQPKNISNTTLYEQGKKTEATVRAVGKASSVQRAQSTKAILAGHDDIKARMKAYRDERKKDDQEHEARMDRAFKRAENANAKGFARVENKINELGDKFVESFFGAGHWALAVIASIISMIIAFIATQDAIAEKASAYVWQVVSYDTYGNVIKVTEHISRVHQWLVIGLIGILVFSFIMTIYAIMKLTRRASKNEENTES